MPHTLWSTVPITVHDNIHPGDRQTDNKGRLSNKILLAPCCYGTRVHMSSILWYTCFYYTFPEKWYQLHPSSNPRCYLECTRHCSCSTPSITRGKMTCTGGDSSSGTGSLISRSWPSWVLISKYTPKSLRYNLPGRIRWKKRAYHYPWSTKRWHTQTAEWMFILHQTWSLNESQKCRRRPLP